MYCRKEPSRFQQNNSSLERPLPIKIQRKRRMGRRSRYHKRHHRHRLLLQERADPFQHECLESRRRVRQLASRVQDPLDVYCVIQQVVRAANLRRRTGGGERDLDSVAIPFFTET